MLIAATAVSMVPWPLIMTTGKAGCARIRCSRMASPSSALPRSQMSRTTSPGRRSSTAMSAESLSPATRQL